MINTMKYDFTVCIILGVVNNSSIILVLDEIVASMGQKMQLKSVTQKIIRYLADFAVTGFTARLNL